jgi:hypothetical protein
MTDEAEQSIPSRGSKPVAWAVILNAIEAISMNGGAVYCVTASKEEADRVSAHAMAVVPLYEHPPVQEYPQWIRAEDRTPSLDGEVLTFSGYGIVVGYYQDGAWHAADMDNVNCEPWLCDPGTVTHWMPLPAPPSEDKQP